MIKLSQRNPEWSSTILGPSKLTVGGYGCTTTCISMFSDYFSEYRNPGFLARNLSYTKDGLILWQSIEKVFKSFKFLWRFYTLDKSLISEALKNPNKVVLLNVDKGYHWVAAIKSIPLTDKYWVYNPWTGKSEIYSGIVGGAILIKK
jgi:hypothetical protein